jgi:TonB family protein
MIKFISKCFGKIALMVAAILWVGCGEKNKPAEQQKIDSEKKPVSFKSERAKLAEEKFDSLMRANGVIRKMGLNGEILNCYRGAYQGMCDTIIAGCLYGTCGEGGGIAVKAKGSLLPPQKSGIEIASGGNLAVDSIMKTLKQRYPGIRHIYNKRLINKPVFEGKVVLTFTIIADGTIDKIEIKSSSTDLLEFDEDIAKAVKRWKFSKSNGETTVTIPFVFSVNEPETP